MCRVQLMRRRPRITKVPRSEHCARTWSPFLSGFYHGIACSHHYQQVGLHLSTFQTENPLTCSEWNFDQFLFAHLFTIIAIELDGWPSDGGAGVVVAEICKNVTTTTGHHPWSTKELSFCSKSESNGFPFLKYQGRVSVAAGT